MTQEKTDGLVVRLVDFSESSRIVTLFTADFGKISALAKGAKRLRGPFEAALDLLAECRVVFLRKPSGGLHLLTEAQLRNRFAPSRRSMIPLYGGYYVAELLAGLTEEDDPHPLLFNESLLTLRRLETDDDPRVPIVRFELALLRELGHLPEFDQCLVCERPVTDGGRFRFWVSQGGLICDRCRKPEYAQSPIHSETIDLLKRLAQPVVDWSPPPTISPLQFRELRYILSAAISHQLERRPATLRYLNFD